MLTWYLRHCKNELSVQKKRLILFLGLLYSIDLMNLLVFQITPEIENPAKLNLYSLAGMLIGGIVFSWIAFRRHYFRISLPFMLKWCIIGQAIFMLGQGYFLYYRFFEAFGCMRFGWATCFSPALGISIAYLLELGQHENSPDSALRIHRRQRTAAAGSVSLVGLLLAAIFVFIFAAFGSANHIVYIGLGIAGLITVLFFDKIVFVYKVGGNKNEYAKEPFLAPYTKNHLLNTRNTQLWFPLIFTGLGTYFFFTLLQYTEKIGYPKLTTGDNTTILGVRYLSTFLGSAIALYASSKYKNRKKILNIYIIGQIAVFLGFVFSPIKSFSSLLIFNILIGFSTSVFMLIILSAAEMTNERIRPVVTILIPALHRGVSVFAFWGITFWVTTDFTAAITWIGLVVLGISLVSVYALDDTNFEGSLNLDDDQDFPFQNDGILLSSFEGKDFLKAYNQKIYDYMIKRYGESIYHIALYEFGKSKKYDLNVLDNPRAWDGLTKYKAEQFKSFLDFAKEMLVEGDMQSLLNYGFQVPELKGIVVHNKHKANIPEGYAVFDLNKIKLEDADEVFGYLADSSNSYYDKLTKLNNCLDKNNCEVFSKDAFQDLVQHRFEDKWIEYLKKTMLMRYLESYRMPDEYVLYAIYPENPSNEVKVVLPLLAATDKVHIKLPMIRNMLSSFVLMKQERLLHIYEVGARFASAIQSGSLEAHFIKDLMWDSKNWENRRSEVSGIIESVLKMNTYSEIGKEIDVIRNYLYVLQPNISFNSSIAGCKTFRIPATLLLNLALNSIKYNKSAGNLSKIELIIRKEEDRVIIEFSDDGVGFPPELVGIPVKTNKYPPHSTDHFLFFIDKIGNILGETHKPFIRRDNILPKGCKISIEFPEALLDIFEKIKQ